MNFASWSAFLVVWILATIPFGPNAVYSMSSAIANGPNRILLAPFGLCLATGVMSFIVAVGIGSVIAASETIFFGIRTLGVVYLFYIGFKIMRSSATYNLDEVSSYVKHSNVSIFMGAFLLSLSNPKALLAYLAVFPSFIDLEHPSVHQLVILLPTTVTVSFCVYGAYALFGHGIRSFMNSRLRWRIFHALAGISFLLFGTFLTLDLIQDF